MRQHRGLATPGERASFCGILLTVLCSLILSTAVSSQAVDHTRQPLRPPDMSSPRATLQAFLEGMDQAEIAIDDAELGQLDVIRRRTLQLLDFGETADGHTWDEQTGRVVLLKEILDRIPLPPFDGIPGASDVLAEDLERWVLPGTQIQIVRVATGERAGDFVFSAGTVARLEQFYRQSAHLPYKQGVTGGLLERHTATDFGEGSIRERIRSRLRSVEDSSPRSLLQHFLVNVNATYRLMMEADAALQADPPAMSRADAVEMERRARLAMQRAVDALDLRDLSETLRDDAGVETALLLKEIFDRTRLPPLDSIPGDHAVAELRKLGDVSGPIRWRFPNTTLEIGELTDGPDAGSFRFTAKTVHDVGDAYEHVADLPYRTPSISAGSETRFDASYASPDISPGVYDYYISTPGFLIPGASWLGPLLADLPPGLQQLYFQQTGWQWVGIAIGLLVIGMMMLLVSAAGRFVSRRVRSPMADWIRLLMPAVNATVVIAVVEFIDTDLNVTGRVLNVALVTGRALVFLFAAIAVFRLSMAIGETVVASSRTARGSASLMRVGIRSLGFLAAMFIAVSGMQTLGADLVPLLAGLGVGGLAVALAIRPTLENMLGGVILIADRPIEVGDHCTFGTNSGVVEGIGLRSTRIRGLDRTLITVPNSDFVNMQLTNGARCDKMLISSIIGLRYETTPDQLRNVLSRMRRICFAHPKIETDTLRVRFADFGASSLDIKVRVFALTNDWDEFHAVREDLFLRFGECIEEAGTSIAFPSRTVYLGKDSGLDPEEILAAERETQALRDAGELPFPRTPQDVADRITDTLDYPPRGSPESPVSKTPEPLSSPRVGTGEGEQGAPGGQA
jgi:MscS family membrane protein